MENKKYRAKKGSDKVASKKRPLANSKSKPSGEKKKKKDKCEKAVEENCMEYDSNPSYNDCSVSSKHHDSEDESSNEGDSDKGIFNLFNFLEAFSELQCQKAPVV